MRSRRGFNGSLVLLALLCLLYNFTVSSARADGMVVPEIAYPSHVHIPDQRALISFSNGTERLVIETRFSGSGTNFAWVVPLPSKPLIEEATTGLFPTLDYIFLPRLRHDDVPYFFLEIGLFIVLGYLLLLVHPTGRLTGVDLFVSLISGVLIAMSCTVRLRAMNVLMRPERMEDLMAFSALLGGGFVLCTILAIRFYRQPCARVPHLWSRAVCGIFGCILAFVLGLPFWGGDFVRHAGGGSSSEAAVSILERRVAGVFETATIASADPAALQSWFKANGFFMPTNAGPAIEAYVREGWVFVAARVCRPKSETEPGTPHPLSFTFKTARAVYPMRLTGLDGQPLQVELYVFGPARAQAPQLRVERCERPEYPMPTQDWWYRVPEKVTILHPLLRQWTAGSPVVTKLSGTLSPRDMREDVWLDWQPYRLLRNEVYSRKGALIRAANLGAGILAVGFVLGFLLVRIFEKGQRPLSLAVFSAVGAGLLCGGVLYACLEKVELTGSASRSASYVPRYAAMCLDALKPVTLANARAYSAACREDDPNLSTNLLLRCRFHEEDSPGNYTFRETAQGLEFVAYDVLGAEHVMKQLPFKPQATGAER